MKRILSVVFAVLSLLLFVSSAFAQYSQTDSPHPDAPEFVPPTLQSARAVQTGAVNDGDTNATNFSRSTPSDVEGKVNVAISYMTGKFNTNVRTHTVYAPFSVVRYFDRWAIAGTLPYIYQRSDQRVVALAGRPQRIRNATSSVRSDSGPGDILGKLGFQGFDETEDPLNLWAVAQVKIPSAEDGTGLGTGKFDETIGLEASKSYNEKWKFFGDLYYTFIGDPDGLNLNNQVTLDLGVRYKRTPLMTYSVAYEDRTNLRANQPNGRDLVFGFRRKAADETVSSFGSLSVGLSEGSPDVGGTLGVSVAF